MGSYGKKIKSSGEKYSVEFFRHKFLTVIYFRDHNKILEYDSYFQQIDLLRPQIHHAFNSY